jgi:nitronate monooxygenase
MALQTSVTRALGVEHPVALAPMDVVADARLSIAVAEAGGYPFLGGGYGEEAWLRRELEVLAPAAQEAGRPFGVGFITWSLERNDRLLDVVLEYRPDSVFLSFGDPTRMGARVKKAGCKLVCQVQTEAMARMALDAGADLLVAQGTEAGGHGGSRGTLTLVPAVADLAGPKVPVLAAGGIADGRGLAACLLLGAGGVVMGTRFYATQESAGSPAAKERIAAASGDDSARSIVFDISRRNVWPAPFTGRCLGNDHLRRWLGREVELLRAMPEAGDLYARARERGDYDTAAVIAGEAAGLVRRIERAGDVVRDTVAAASELLAAGARTTTPAPRAAATAA